ncbi:MULTISPECIES: cobalt-precorrin-5B (C(1))-methyltransferase CbiD [unclassified Candidatus Frackibacter]|uniref:cobalt-precorrin-5B (C(1))-methyltransferase CbiD n=1 Tax=unclassified Candidatus Frackibacter TaxID=2648818 RepID=UPI0007938C96|nr:MULTISPECIES: cobalt-precorrin-5B (C(1))-methyltransferase CbiD [unclassified Candidatus Frackibacter]KXS43890.1 MAG: cobalt-precorrin-5B (C1)-methyltransferase [Candidatus Frackibacter sp. T328-2]SDC33981.1 cobalt-precorrin 5B C1-methyltransferase [Candidatus Frackibacter sp. WG11]SEM57215.1 cobalt-precorrin 5B C1-methyltransferase [Candidatus Frackibacter sp. WG12]SFL70058.1 cobalt-precorrin 5B C1-methyltransferase [Candidatus Frackibacter sp. WG13]
MFESYIERDGKKLRRGYTTGTTAAGAAKAATQMLYSQEIIEEVMIETPAGIDVNLEIIAPNIEQERVSCTVIKDAGDDPDITDGLEIVAEVSKIKAGIEIEGGQGVGVVTKPGLAVKVGEPAINPVPRKMIIDEVKKVLPANAGVKVRIKVPEGEEVAKKTFNPRLGIKGGISILGTTGIVEPMSKRAYKESLVIAIDQAIAEEREELVFIFGNYGKRMANNLGIVDEEWIKMSNFVGYMLERAAEKGIKRIILLGHIGKLVKVAAGIFDTHSKIADGRLETIAAYTASLGGSQDLINGILKANTAEETVQILKEARMATEVFNFLAKRVVIRAAEKVNQQIDFGSIIFSMEKEILGSYGVDLEKGATGWRIRSIS